MTSTEPRSTDARTVVGIVPHTHWDREWYAPFQDFRHRLVRILDEFLPRLEADPSYARFLLDGQTAVIDDYLEVRPEAEERLVRLASSGRLGVGPWAILMDEYMVSGETIVRDLQMGIARAARFGGAMDVGYLPDMFGHVAQMPQILRLAGLEHAVVWRGVPSAVQQTAFWWEALDGSRVRAEFLVGSYSNGRDLPREAEGLIERARGYERELGDARLAGGGLLLMNGTDHQVPQPWLGEVVAAANAAQDEYTFVVTSLPEYVAVQPSEGLTTIVGEMRSGVRSNVLMGVASNRVDIHQECARAERIIERRAEPLQAMLIPADEYAAAAELAIAWRLLVLNSAHDSSCACSSDDVVDAVKVRYREVQHIGEGLVRDALVSLAVRVDAPAESTIIVNPSARTRGGLVTALVTGEGPVHVVPVGGGAPRPTQTVALLDGEAFRVRVKAEMVSAVLDMARGPEFAGYRIARYEILMPEGEGDIEVRTHVATDSRVIDLEPMRGELTALATADPQARFHFRVMRQPTRSIVFAADDVPGFGWRSFVPVEGAGPSTGVGAEGLTLRNEHLTLTIDEATGTYAITTADGVTTAGLGRIVEGGDGGDTYNYSPPKGDVTVDTPTAVRVRTAEAGPVFARATVEADYDWPSHAIGDERKCTARAESTLPHTVVTTLELRTGEPFVRVQHEIDNRSRDHRVRAHFPLPAPVAGSRADCAFAVVERGLETEGAPHEYALPTWVSRRFVDASDGTVGLGLVHDGLLEYEVVDGGTELALTLFRSTGYLSRSEMYYRPNAAGPLLPVEGAQVRQPLTLTYAVVPHRGDWAAADLLGAADAVLVPLDRIRRGEIPGDSLPAQGARLAVDGLEVSALHRSEGGLALRGYNPFPEDRTVTVTLDGAPATGWVVDLVGRPLEAFDGTRVVRSNEILSLQLAD
jgi:hypothetical protein